MFGLYFAASALSVFATFGLDLPPETRIFVGHDYQPPGRGEGRRVAGGNPPAGPLTRRSPWLRTGRPM